MSNSEELFTSPRDERTALKTARPATLGESDMEREGSRWLDGGDGSVTNQKTHHLSRKRSSRSPIVVMLDCTLARGTSEARVGNVFRLNKRAVCIYRTLPRSFPLISLKPLTFI